MRHRCPWPGLRSDSAYRPAPPDPVRRERIEVEGLRFGGYLETLLSRAEDRGGVPRFVEQEMRPFPPCRVAAHGFVRVHSGTVAMIGWYRWATIADEAGGRIE